MTRRSWILFLSRRWFGGARRGRGSSAGSMLAAAGIAVGVTTLIVVLGVMNGFQGGYIDSIIEVSSFHVRIEPGTGPESPALAAEVSTVPGVRSVLRFRETKCLLSSARRGAMVMAIRTLPPDVSTLDPGFARALGIHGEEALREGEILLGTEVARQLAVVPGDLVRAAFVVQDPEEGIVSVDAELTVGGIFRSGYYEFDSGLGLISENTASAQLPAAAPGAVVYGVKLTNRFDDALAGSRIASLPGTSGMEVFPWREYNRSFFGALRMEKTVMMLLIGLIFLVVGVNIFHAMRRRVAERTADIALVLTLGARSGEVQAAFLLDSLVIGAGGSALGGVAGLVIASNINGLFRIAESVVSFFTSTLPSWFGSDGREFRVFSSGFFYMLDIPVRVSPAETAFILMAATASAAIAALAASTRLSRLHPSEVLRYE